VLTLEETKELVRHPNIQTTSDIHGGLSLAAKRAAQTRLVELACVRGKGVGGHGIVICPQLSFLGVLKSSLSY
jgi:hypothetical protein